MTSTFDLSIHKDMSIHRLLHAQGGDLLPKERDGSLGNSKSKHYFLGATPLALEGSTR